MTTLTVQVLESSGLIRVQKPRRDTVRCDRCQSADASVTWVERVGAYLCSDCRRIERTSFAGPIKQPTRAQIDQALARMSKGHKAWPASRYCCGFGRVRTACPLH